MFSRFAFPKGNLPMLVAVLLLAPGLLAQSREPAYKYILDYDVPESPALVALGVTPAKVLRGSAAKPVVLNLLNQVGFAKRVQNGVAVDFSPYFTFGGRLRSIEEYRTDGWKRLAANSQLSIATIQSEEETNALLFGLGLRTTLFDSHDLLQDKELGEDIDEILLGSIEAPTPAETGDVDEIEVDVTPAYEKARNRLLKKTGSALAVGYGASGRLKSSIANTDSIDNVKHTAWLSFKYSFGGGTDFLSIYQGQYATPSHPEHRFGIAIRKNGTTLNVAGEIVYTSRTKRFEIGANLEVRLLNRIGAVVSLSSEQPSTTNHSLIKMKLNTIIRWNLSQ